LTPAELCLKLQAYNMDYPQVGRCCNSSRVNWGFPQTPPLGSPEEQRGRDFDQVNSAFLCCIRSFFWELTLNTTPAKAGEDSRNGPGSLM